MRHSSVFVWLVLALWVEGTAAQTIVERAQQDEIAYMSREEPAMPAAFARANATLDEFLAKASNPSAGTADYALKVAISDGRNTEYFWVNNFASAGTASMAR
jgi:uncharacterized protein YegJ (DUF2314 family)